MNKPSSYVHINGGVSGPGPSHVLTASGKHIDLANPSAELIQAEDLAHGLALTCRYNGQIRRFYSVAEHSVLCYDLRRYLGASPEEALPALLHDTPEALLGDVTTPLKYVMRSAGQASPYDEATDLLEVAIAERFQLDAAMFSTPEVKQVDVWALRIEAERLTNPAGGEWAFPDDLPNGGALPSEVDFACGLDWMGAKNLFLERLASVIGWAEVWR